MTLPRVFLVAFVLSIAGLLLVAARGADLGVSPREHTRYVAGMRRMEGLHARLHEQMLRARSGLFGSYDAIDATSRSLRALADELSALPSFMTEAEADRMRQALDGVHRVLEAEGPLVETFKSEHAVLRNSLRFFPIAATRVADALDADRSESEPNAPILASALRALLRDVLELAAFGGEELAARVTADVVGLRATESASETLLDLPLRHATVIAERTPRVEAALRLVLAQPLPQALEEASASYEGAHAAALARARQNQTALFVLMVCALGFGSLAVIFRMRASAAALARTTLQLRAALDQQHRFVSMTSHEFRTPLSVIMSSTDLLEAYSERWSLPQRRTHLARITRAARGMTDLLDGLLLIGRTDAGHTDFRPTPTDVRALADEVLEAQRLRSKAGATVALTCPKLPTLKLDARLVRHVLDNLVSNAVKYGTPGTEAKVALHLVGDVLHIEVTDHGIGIPDADLDGLFSSFHRATNVGAVPGSGLGLAIVKRALDQHRGTVEVRSQVGVGTTFEVRIPVERADDERDDEAPQRTDASRADTEGPEGTRGS